MLRSDLIVVLIGIATSRAAAVSNLRSAQQAVRVTQLAQQQPPAVDQAAAQQAADQARAQAEEVFDYQTWTVGGLVAVVVIIVAAAAAWYFSRKKKTEAEVIAVQNQGEKASSYEELLKLAAQKVAQETGPKLSKASAVRNVLESRMANFTNDTKNFLLAEMNGTAGAVLRELDAPEAMLLMNFNNALEANFPPAAILLAGLMSPSVISIMNIHHIVQMLVVGVPVLILCICAIHIDWSSPCTIPTIFPWLFTQTALAACLVIGHGMLVVKCTLGKKRVTAKAAELQAEAEKKRKERTDDDGVDDMRDDFVNSAISLQEALLVENEIRRSVWGYIVGIATSAWVITTIWNLVLICRYTFVPGIVAFHPKAAEVAKDDFCGAWMTVLVLRVNILLAVLFFFFNLATVVQWVCDLMIESKGFQDSVINYARGMDNKGSGLPVMETFVKAFLLRGGSDTLDAQLQGVKGRKKSLENEQASLAAQLAALESELAGAKSEEQALKTEVLSKGGDFADQIKKMEQQGTQIVEDVEAKAKEIQAQTAEAMEELYEKIQKAVEEAAQSEFVQMVRAKAGKLEGMAEEAIAAAKDPAKQRELQKRAQEALQKAQQAAQDIIEAAEDPEKRKQLEEAAEKAMQQAKQAAENAAANLQDPEVQKKLKQAAQEAMDHAQAAAKDAVEKAEYNIVQAEKTIEKKVEEAKKK